MDKLTVPREKWREILSVLLGTPIETATVETGQWDDMILADGRRFGVEYKATADTPRIAQAIMQVRNRVAHAATGNLVPILVVPYMTEAARKLCEQAEVNWCDVAGNARIIIPGIRVIISGQGKPPSEKGRPRGPFSRRASMVAHFLLLHASGVYAQTEIATATGLDQGFVSRIVTELENRGLVKRTAEGIRLLNPTLMLDAWRESYRFPVNRIVRGVVPSRSGIETLNRLASSFQKAEIPHAFTGLGAAWKFDPFADFRIVTCYVLSALRQPELETIGFVPTERGCNVWMLQNADGGVLLGSRILDGIQVVSPILTYLDLKAHPERSAEAADHLYNNVIRKALKNGE